MDASEQNDSLRAVTNRFFPQTDFGILSSAGPPFDTSKPNLHDSKTEFLAEKELVLKACENALGVIDFCFAALKNDDPNRDCYRIVSEFVDTHLRRKHVAVHPKDVLGMIEKNAADFGATHALLFLTFSYHSSLLLRKQELEDQEGEFWSGNSRPPNHYARVIALRFARLIAKETGVKPTFGTSKDGGHPSTDFGRGVEEIFEILGISAQFKNPAKWAIDQLTDEDCKRPPGINLLGLGGGFRRPSAGRNAIVDMMTAQTKDIGS